MEPLKIVAYSTTYLTGIGCLKNSCERPQCFWGNSVYYNENFLHMNALYTPSGAGPTSCYTEKPDHSQGMRVMLDSSNCIVV